MSDASKFPRSSNYDIGYGKPPAAHHFQPGQSGNPKGRPKGAKNKLPKKDSRLIDLVISEASREITVECKSGTEYLSIAESVLRSLSLKAIQGHLGAQRAFLSILEAAEIEKAKEKKVLFEEAYDYKTAMYARIEEAKHNGSNIEHKILPHPDHVILDARTLDVKFIGPVDELDRDLWNNTWQLKKECEKQICFIKDELEELKENSDHRGMLERSLELLEYSLSECEVGIISLWNQPLEDVVVDPHRRPKIESLVENKEWPERPKFLR